MRVRGPNPGQNFRRQRNTALTKQDFPHKNVLIHNLVTFPFSSAKNSANRPIIYLYICSTPSTCEGPFENWRLMFVIQISRPRLLSMTTARDQSAFSPRGTLDFLKLVRIFFNLFVIQVSAYLQFELGKIPINKYAEKYSQKKRKQHTEF